MKINNHAIQPIFISIFFIYVFSIAFLALFSSKAIAQLSNLEKNLQILDYELIPPREIKTTRIGQQKASTLTISFDALDQNFNLKLEPNSRLLENLSGAQKKRLTSSLKLYRGYIDGVENSWVRLSQKDHLWSGMIWDGFEMYVIDSSEEVLKALQGNITVKEASPVIFRLTDTIRKNALDYVVEPRQEPLPRFAASSGTHWQHYPQLIDHLKSLIKLDKIRNTPQSILQLNIAVVADAQFNANHSNPEEQIISHMNVVDGIFTEQIGVHFNLSKLHLLTDNGSLTSKDAHTLLQQFRNFAVSHLSNPGLIHLFTGRNLTGGVVGMAYRGVLCNKRYGVGLSQTEGVGAVGAMLIAHELGHNFGAPHDNQQNSQCADESNQYLMNPYISGTDQFSQCSVEKIHAHMETASCLKEVTLKHSNLTTTLPANKNQITMGEASDKEDKIYDNSDLAIDLSAKRVEAHIGNSFEMLINVTNQGKADAQNSTAIVNIPAELSVETISSSFGSCSIQDNQANCQLDQISAGDLRSIRLKMRAHRAGNFVTEARVYADNDENSWNNTMTPGVRVWNNHSYTLNQADLIVDVPGNSIRTQINEIFEYKVRIVNQGNEIANRPRITVNIPAHLKVQTAALDIAQKGDLNKCYVRYQRKVICALKAMPENSGYNLTLTMQGATKGQYATTIIASANNDRDRSNNIMPVYIHLRDSSDINNDSLQKSLVNSISDSEKSKHSFDESSNKEIIAAMR